MLRRMLDGGSVRSALEVALLLGSLVHFSKVEMPGLSSRPSEK
jgi:hypothetical protein